MKIGTLDLRTKIRQAQHRNSYKDIPQGNTLTIKYT
jgi:hypothetical protein